MGEKNYVGTPLQVFEHDGGAPIVPEPAESSKWPNFPEDEDKTPSQLPAHPEPEPDENP